MTEKIGKVLIAVVMLGVAGGAVYATPTGWHDNHAEVYSDVSTETDNELSTWDEFARILETESGSEEQEATTKKDIDTLTVQNIEMTEHQMEPPIEPAYEEEEAGYNDYDSDDGHGGYIGTFELTAYEWTGNPMANGEYPYYGACASNYFAIDTVLYIEGYGTFTVCDRGRMSDNVIDIYLGDEEACWEFGRKYNVPVYYG